MLAHAQFHLLELLLLHSTCCQIRFTWSRALANHLVYRVFPCPICLGRILLSSVDALKGTDIGLVWRFGNRDGLVPPIRIRPRLLCLA